MIESVKKRHQFICESAFHADFKPETNLNTKPNKSLGLILQIIILFLQR